MFETFTIKEFVDGIRMMCFTPDDGKAVLIKNPHEGEIKFPWETPNKLNGYHHSGYKVRWYAK